MSPSESTEPDPQPSQIVGEPVERAAYAGFPEGSSADAAAIAADGPSIMWRGEDVFTITLLAQPRCVPVAVTTRATGDAAIDAVFQPTLAQDCGGDAEPYSYDLRLPDGVDGEQSVAVRITGIGDPATVTLEP